MAEEISGTKLPWVIEVRWGFGDKWSRLGNESYETKEECEGVIRAMRDLANKTDCRPEHLAYRDIPLQASLLPAEQKSGAADDDAHLDAGSTNPEGVVDEPEKTFMLAIFPESYLHDTKRGGFDVVDCIDRDRAMSIGYGKTEKEAWADAAMRQGFKAVNSATAATERTPEAVGVEQLTGDCPSCGHAWDRHKGFCRVLMSCAGDECRCQSAEPKGEDVDWKAEAIAKRLKFLSLTVEEKMRRCVFCGEKFGPNESGHINCGGRLLDVRINSLPVPKEPEAAQVEPAPEAAGPLDEIGRECIVTRDTHRLLTETSEDFADRIRRTLIAERRQRTPSPATERASETATLTYADGYAQGRKDEALDMRNHGEPKAEGAEKVADVDLFAWAKLVKDTKRHFWFNQAKPIINAIGEISVQEAMDAIERLYL